MIGPASHLAPFLCGKRSYGLPEVLIASRQVPGKRRERLQRGRLHDGLIVPYGVLSSSRHGQQHDVVQGNGEHQAQRIPSGAQQQRFGADIRPADHQLHAADKHHPKDKGRARLIGACSHGDQHHSGQQAPADLFQQQKAQCREHRSQHIRICIVQKTQRRAYAFSPLRLAFLYCSKKSWIVNYFIRRWSKHSCPSSASAFHAAKTGSRASGEDERQEPVRRFCPKSSVGLMPCFGTSSCA